MKTDKIYIIHIIECISHIEEYTQNDKSTFFESTLVQDATIRNLEIIGEATKKVSLSLRQSHPEVPWKEMAGLRDVLIHDYFGVDVNIVWNVIEREIPKLKLALEKILQEAL